MGRRAKNGNGMTTDFKSTSNLHFNLFYYIDIYRDMYTVQYINPHGLLHLQQHAKNRNITVVIVKVSELSLFTNPVEMTVMNYKLY